MSKVEKAISR